MNKENFFRNYLIGIGIGLVLCVVIISLDSCRGAVLANGTSMVINKPTQITEDQVGDFTVTGGSLYGLPAANGDQVKITGNITVTKKSLLQDLHVIGCIVIETGANRVELYRVWVEGCSGDGITFKGDGTSGSCCAKLFDVVSAGNGGNGLSLIGSADVFINPGSEFENNHGFGLQMAGSPTVRIVNSDFGGNVLGGIAGDRDSGLAMMTNNQFGNNQGDDVALQAPAILNSLEFIGPDSKFCAVRSSVAQILGANFYGPRPRC